jgi:hypothetical protein
LDIRKSVVELVLHIPAGPFDSIRRRETLIYGLEEIHYWIAMVGFAWLVYSSKGIGHGSFEKLLSNCYELEQQGGTSDSTLPF